MVTFVLFLPLIAFAQAELLKLGTPGAPLVPAFTQSITDYGLSLPSESAQTVLLSSPAAPATRRFLAPADAPWIKLAAGPTFAAGRAHSLVLRGQGQVLAWGDNLFGQTDVPSAAQGTTTALASGLDHSLALLEDGTVLAWGDNNFGQCDIPSAALGSIVAVAAGERFSLALRADGTLVSMGRRSPASRSRSHLGRRHRHRCPARRRATRRRLRG